MALHGHSASRHDLKKRPKAASLHCKLHSPPGCQRRNFVSLKQAGLTGGVGLGASGDCDTNIFQTTFPLYLRPANVFGSVVIRMGKFGVQFLFIGVQFNV